MLALAARRFVVALVLGSAACTTPRPPAHEGTGAMSAPVARRIPHRVSAPGGVRDDPYHWLRDDTRSSPEVLAYLKAENAYTDALLAPLAADREALYAEMVSRLPPDDASAPVTDHGFVYGSRYVAGGEYPVLSRRPVAGGPEQLLLDGNALAAHLPYFHLGDYAVSDDGALLVYAADEVGRSEYVIRVKDLASGALLPDTLRGADDSVAFSADGRSILYIEKDPETLLGVRVKRHRLGTDVQRDELLYEEKDHAFFLSLARSPSRRFLFIHAASTLSDEQLVADARDPALAFRPILPRAPEHKYGAEEHGDAWIVRSNLGAPNFRIVSLPMGHTSLATAEELVPEPRAGLIEDMAVFERALAYEARSDGQKRVLVRSFADGHVHGFAHDEQVYTESLDDNRDPSLDYVSLRFSSFTTPDSVIHGALADGTQTLVKRDAVRGGYDPALYASERLSVAARDGTEVPVSLMYLRTHRHDGQAPLYLTGYGAYGISEDPEFSSARLSLVSRGVVFAIAHVRGGEELGRAWYDAGRLAQKPHTFTDFIDVTRALGERGVAAPGRVAARGASAGGLLIGAVANTAPELYRVMVAHVPFVDVVTTMLDPSIPLTTNEYDEWGNPAEKRWYDVMLGYSPYDNVRAQAYPALFVTTGLWDSQVQYYEPAKWVAKLRATKTDAHPLLLRTNMDAGHAGRSGRFTRRRELAEEYAFVLSQLGVPR